VAKFRRWKEVTIHGVERRIFSLICRINKWPNYVWNNGNLKWKANYLKRFGKKGNFEEWTRPLSGEEAQ